MRLKNVIALGVAVVTFTGTALGVSAANLKDIFDAKYYASQYPDLQEAYGNDEELLYQHFITYGIKEGRNMNPVLDVVAYREAYSDLDQAFGDDWDKYVDHFFAFGARENREEGVMLNPIQYAAAYSDIKEAYGNDLVSIAQHYETFGRSENREAGTSRGFRSISAMKDAESLAASREEAASSSSTGTPDVSGPSTPTETPDVPGPSTPTETPDVSGPSTPTETPDVPGPSTPTETPDVPGPSTPTETPDVPGPSTPTETPDVPGPSTPTETPDVPGPSTPTETPGEQPSESELYNKMIALKDTYPDGTPWTNEGNSYMWEAANTMGYGCAAFAYMVSDAAFGKEAPVTESRDVSSIRVGDVVRLNNDTHSVIVLSVAENGDVTVAEGNISINNGPSSVLWGRTISKAELESSFTYLQTRY